ncbi:hypothetical protein C8R43DRAFT_871920 [Mycena crocata]|nr:hypothetical protein C8R43DRAFT_871920 [Mycena crocata]
MAPDTLELLTLTVLHPRYSEIACVTAVRLRRPCYGIFLEVMHIDTELFTMGSTLFDKYGEVRPWHVENEYHKGSGAWGRELNEGRLVFVLFVSVDAPYRKQGIGSWALRQLYASEHIEENDKLICWPSPVPRPPQDQWLSAFDEVVTFYRKVGYRRIGATSFFGYAQDPEHPSRKIAHLHDFDPCEKYLGGPDPIPRFALHDMIFEDKSENIGQRIRDAHAADPASIEQPNTKGFRPIHVAVKSANLPALRTLIALGLAEESFTSRDNGDHWTPLEACEGDMRSSREVAEIFKHVGGWEGFEETALWMQAALKRAMGHAMPPTDDEYVAKQKWGCTCGRCIGGWLSPRTLIRLKGESQMVSGVPLTPEDVDIYATALTYIPLHLRRELFKTFIVGYAAVMKAIALILDRGALPTDAAVHAELQNGGIDFFAAQAAQFYFKKGGQVAYALAAVVNSAQDELEAGAFSLTAEDLGLVGTALVDQLTELFTEDERIREAPECANDREWDIVKKNVGLDPLQDGGWGPYSLKSPLGMDWRGMMFEDEEGSDGGEDGDED